MKEMKVRNCSIDVFRLLAACLVVACHADILIEGPEEVYLFAARYAPRVGVAFFFAVSGYFYIQALMAGKDVFKKQLFSLLQVYGVWSVIYYFCSFVVNVIMDGESIWKFLMERVIYFVTCGSYSHFWFFTALIYSVILATLFYKLSPKRGLPILTALSLVLFVVGNLGSSYYEIGLKIPYFRTFISEYRWEFEVFRGNLCMGLPYFMMGYFLNQLGGFLEKVEQKKLALAGIVTAVLYVSEILVLSQVLEWYEYPEVFVMLYPAAFVLLLILLKNPKPEWKAYAGNCKRLSAYIYYVHPLLILGINIISEICGIYIPSVLLYIIVMAIAAGSGWILIHINKKIKWVGYLL